MVVVLVNVSLRLTIFLFTKILKYDNTTMLISSYINKYIFLYFCNAAFMPYLIHGIFDGPIENKKMLLFDIHFILVASSLSTPLAKIFDPTLIKKIFKRWSVNSFK